MKFKLEKDYGLGQRKISMILSKEELERAAPALVEDLLAAERADNPAEILEAWAALTPRTMGALQMSLIGEGEGEGADEDC